MLWMKKTRLAMRKQKMEKMGRGVENRQRGRLMDLRIRDGRGVKRLEGRGDGGMEMRVGRRLGRLVGRSDGWSIAVQAHPKALQL